MTPESTYNKWYNASFEHVQSYVNQRYSGSDYSWLLTTDMPLVPDYFTVRSIGRSFFQRLLNYSVSNRFHQFSPSYVVIKRFVTLFYQLPMLSAHQASLHWLLTHLKDPPNEMMDWTLVEFFWFMVQWSERVDANGFDFSEIKKTANDHVLAMVKSVIGNNVMGWDFDVLVHAACYANWLDVVVPDYEQRESSTINALADILHSSSSLIQLREFTSSLGDVATIMYECDNAGEVVLDLLVIMRLIATGRRVVVVAKYGSVLNDVTLDELGELIDKEPLFFPIKEAVKRGECDLISANNFTTIGKYLPQSS